MNNTEEHLVALADELDKIGFIRYADYIDLLIKISATNEETIKRLLTWPHPDYNGKSKREVLLGGGKRVVYSAVPKGYHELLLMIELPDGSKVWLEDSAPYTEPTLTKDKEKAKLFTSWSTLLSAAHSHLQRMIYDYDLSPGAAFEEAPKRKSLIDYVMGK